MATTMSAVGVLEVAAVAAHNDGHFGGVKPRLRMRQRTHVLSRKGVPIEPLKYSRHTYFGPSAGSGGITAGCAVAQRSVRPAFPSKAAFASSPV
jgi:hypothetical protein